MSAKRATVEAGRLMGRLSAEAWTSMRDLMLAENAPRDAVMRTMNALIKSGIAARRLATDPVSGRKDYEFRFARRSRKPQGPKAEEHDP